jgi:hypothetical protein
LIQNAVIVPIFYGSAWTAPAQANEIVMLDAFMEYITSAKSPLIAFLSSQYDVTPKTPGYDRASYTIDGGTLWAGNSLEPTGNDVVNVNVPPVLIDGTDPSIIEQEINEGHVPAPTASAIYVVFTPPGVKVYDAERAGVPIGREWYGFHDAFGNSSSSSGFAYYVAVTSPGDAFENLSGSVGGRSLNAFQSLTEILTHELTEAITDPKSDGSGWNDRQFANDGEIADMGLEPNAYDQRKDLYQKNWLTVLDDYTVPQLWSKKTKGPASLPGAKPATKTPATSLSTLAGPALGPLADPVTPGNPSTFTWAKIAGANWYEFELKDIATSRVITRITANTSISVGVTAGHTYQGMVRAFSNDGVMGNWSTTSQFKVHLI